MEPVAQEVHHQNHEQRLQPDRPGMRPERRDRQVQRTRGPDERVGEHETHERREGELDDRHESEIGLDFTDRRAPLGSVRELQLQDRHQRRGEDDRHVGARHE